MAYRKIDAELAQAVYETNFVTEHVRGLSENGWSCKVVMENGISHYKGCIFVNNMTNDIAVVHKGTKVKNMGDIKANLDLLMGEMPEQQKDADYMIKKAKIYAKNNNIAIEKIRNIGHSLGGSLAQLVGHDHSDIETVTFNPYGVGVILDKEEADKDYDNITNHISSTDPVSIFHGSKQIGQTLSYDAPIENSGVREAIKISNSLQQHSIKLFNNPKFELWNQPGRSVKINTAFSRMVLNTAKYTQIIHDQLINKIDGGIRKAKNIIARRIEKRKKQISDKVNHIKYEFGSRVVYTLETIENELNLFDSEIEKRTKPKIKSF